jgi:hypothetical protein
MYKIPRQGNILFGKIGIAYGRLHYSERERGSDNTKAIRTDTGIMLLCADSSVKQRLSIQTACEAVVGRMMTCTIVMRHLCAKMHSPVRSPKSLQAKNPQCSPAGAIREEMSDAVQRGNGAEGSLVQ